MSDRTKRPVSKLEAAAVAYARAKAAVEAHHAARDIPAFAAALNRWSGAMFELDAAAQQHAEQVSRGECRAMARGTGPSVL